MAITAITRDFNESPNIVRIVATNTLAEVAASDYVTSQEANITALNSGTWTWLVGDLILVQASDGDQFFQFDGDDFTTFIQLPGGNGEVTLPVVDGDFTVFDGTLGALKDAGYSASDPAKTKVVMAGSATVINTIAHFIDTAGTIDDTAANVTNLGNIIAGASGTAGTLTSFPSAATSGSLILAAVTNSGGDFNTTISNAASVGQAQVISIPDSGASTANFILSKTTGTQHITVGSLQVDAGNISAGISAGGTAGTFLSYPATGSKGALILAAVANTGNTNVTISNAAHGQASVYSIPDGGQTTSNFLISNSAGTQTIATGNLAFTAGYSQISAVNALTAHSGGGQGSATALTRQINRVTTVAAGGDSVLLPAAIAGRWVTVTNAAASNAMDVFPASGEIINALSANTALSVVANTTAIFFCAVAGTWNTVVTA